MPAHPPSRARRGRTALALAVVAVPLGLAAAGPAGAARTRPAPPPPVPTVPPPADFRVTDDEAVRVIFAIDTDASYTHEVQVVSGPTGTPSGDVLFGVPVTAFLSDRGWWMSPLAASSDYVIRARRTAVYDPVKRTLQPVTSPWASFTFRTPSLAASRPSAPVLTAGAATAGTVTVNWAPSTDNSSDPTRIGYTYTRDGVEQGPTCFAYCFGATGLRVPRPAAGTSARITVTAIDDAGIRSLPSAEIVITG